MKKLLTTLSMIMVIIFSSCEKFLDTKPEDFLSSVNYFQTEKHLEYSITGVYDILGLNPLYGANYHSKLGMEADEGYYNRANMVVGPQVYNITRDNTDILNFWTTLYKGIGRANFLLENVDNNPNISKKYRDRIRGEALFLRGYYYFLLVQNFGGVPLMLESTKNANDVHVPKVSAKEVYEQVITDMELAETLVPPIQEIGNGGRVSQSAVRGILARVCLYMAGEPVKDITKYEKARFWAKKVIDDVEAGHRLNPNFYDVFINYASDKYDYRESIWEVEFWGNATDMYREGGYLGSWHGLGYGLNTNSVSIGYSQGIIRATRQLYEKYMTDGGEADLRKDWSIAPFRYATGGVRSFFTSAPTNAQKYERFSGKYRREFELVIPKNANTTPINHPLLRYSDVLLMFAEADNEVNNGPSDLATDKVNEVRERAWSTGINTISVVSGGSGYTAIPTVTITGGGGSGALARATVSGGKVNSVILIPNDLGYSLAKGSYTSVPTITITGGGGAGAIAIATIHKKEDARIAYGLGKAAFLKLIQDERSRELCFEALRKQDLIRWGIFYDRMKEVQLEMEADNPAGSANAFMSLAYKNVEKKHLLFPIPANEIGINRVLEQNPDWL